MSTRTPAFYHLCICVSDLERSLRFYCEGLGFTRNESFRIGSEMAPLVQIDGGLALNSVYLGLSGVRLELWHFEEPRAERPAPRPMNSIGLTHFAIRVADIDDAIARAEAHGGRCLRSTRTRADTDGFRSEIVYVMDPDGVRVELLWMPEGVDLSLTA